eukprot:symbB.v1.2.027584.t1/scaffold2769.1/size71079/2
MFAPRSLRRSTSAPGRGAERGAETLGRSSPARGRKSVEPEVKALAKEPQIRSCATADGKLDATSDSVVVEKSEGLRKTLSCSAKGILTRTRDVSPITSPAPPQITPPTLYAALGHAASRTLLRETSGPLPPYTMSVPTAPVTMPLNAILSPPVPYPARPSALEISSTSTSTAAASHVFKTYRCMAAGSWRTYIATVKASCYATLASPTLQSCTTQDLRWNFIGAGTYRVVCRQGTRT